ncbi:amino acid transporter-7 [Coleophoma cylindrospora]|uniref:Amino acid transporter-7 n=1 Tax=Coleophoma cylindrospora TaxID=1849047 RepID=A0A3D8R0E5_9HELO|nr:amino acid transporter-7 [Coleophoma cylindrospora]
MSSTSSLSCPADQEPLIQRSDSPTGSITSYKSIPKSDNDDLELSLTNSNSNPRGRSVENDVLPETAVLGRNLGWSSAYILIMSRVIGSGIFATPGAIVRSVGSVGITLLLWIAGALIAWLGLAISLEYGCMLPRSGGDKVYLEFVYRRPRFLASVLIAVRSVLLGFTASNCIVFGEYVLYAFKREQSQFEGKVLAIGLLTTIVIIHSCFLKTGIFIQNVFGWVKISLAIFMVLTSLFVLLFRSNGTTDNTIQIWTKGSNIWDGSVWNWGITSTAMFKVSYSYAGLSNVNNVLNEVKDPVRTLKSAATTALITSCILYLLVNIAYFLVVPMEEIKSSGELIAALFFERVFGAKLGSVLLPLAIATSAAGNVMVVTFSHARVIQEIARQGFLPFSQFISSSKPFGAPMGALVTHYIPSFLVISIPAANVYSFILDVEGYPGQFFSIAGSLGLLWLRYKRSDLQRPYKAFLPAVTLQALHSTAVIFAPFIPREDLNWRQHLSEVSYAFVGTAVIVFGICYWYVWTVWLPRRSSSTLEEIEAILDDGTTVTRLLQVPIGFKPTLTTEQADTRQTT